MYFIVGATGSLGGQVARSLLEQGERVRILVRPDWELRRGTRFTDPNELRDLGAEVVEGDLRQPETLAPHLAGVSAVLMTASGTKRMPPDTIEAVDVDGARALSLSARQAGVEHLVYVSAHGANPHAPGLLASKWQGENAIRESGQRATVVRPSLYMQDWIGFVLGAQLQGGSRIQLVGENDPARSFVHEGDVARLLTQLLLAGPHSDAEPVSVVEFGTDTASHGEIAERMARVTGFPIAVERIAPGDRITTVPEPYGAVITHLLTMMASAPDDPFVTPEVCERYGLEPVTIDMFLADGMR